MRINLTKKDLVNLVYMQLGFSKKISEHLIDDFLDTIVDNLESQKMLKISKFGTFSIRNKKSRIGRNPLTKEKIVISSRNVVLFKPSKEFKNYINLNKTFLFFDGSFLSDSVKSFKIDCVCTCASINSANKESSDIEKISFTSILTPSVFLIFAANKITFNE